MYTNNSEKESSNNNNAFSSSSSSSASSAASNSSLFFTFRDDVNSIPVPSVNNNNIQTHDLTKTETEKVIEGIETLFLARKDYNDHWVTYLSQVEENDFLEFKRVYNIELNVSREYLINGCKEYVDFYQSILDKINANFRDQNLADQLHYMILKRHQIYSPIERAGKNHHHLGSVEWRKARNFLESNFLASSVSELESSNIISKSEISFFRDFKFSGELDKKDGLIQEILESTSINPEKNPFYSIVKTIQQITRLIDKLDIKEQDDIVNAAGNSNVNTLLNRAIFFNKIRNDLLSKDLSVHEKLLKSLWDLYRLAYNQSIEAEDILAKITGFLGTLNEPVLKEAEEEKLEKRKDKHVHKPQTPQKKSVGGEASSSASSGIVNTNKESTGEIPLASAPIVLVQDSDKMARLRQLQAFKDKVSQERDEKERVKKREREIQDLAIKRNAASKEDLLSKKGEIAKKSAFMLLGNLNSNNFTLVEKIFNKPTPHREIPYRDIELLFGNGDGNIPGKISSEGGGSHRKITIFFSLPHEAHEKISETKGIGFFDDVFATGGTFMPHGSAHSNGNLPSIEIKRIRGTLERVGVTRENLDLFIAAKNERTISNRY